MGGIVVALIWGDGILAYQGDAGSRTLHSIWRFLLRRGLSVAES